MRILVVALLMFSFVSTPAVAVSKSHRSAAEELLNASGMKDSMNKMIEQMVQLQLRQKPMMEPYRDIMLGFFRKYLGYENIRNDFIDIYTEEFSEKELREISAFYRTPTGRKTIEKMPILMNKGAQVGMGKVKTHINELREMIQEKAKKIAAESVKPAPEKK